MNRHPQLEGQVPVQVPVPVANRGQIVLQMQPSSRLQPPLLPVLTRRRKIWHLSRDQQPLFEHRLLKSWNRKRIKRMKACRNWCWIARKSLWPWLRSLLSAVSFINVPWLVLDYFHSPSLIKCKFKVIFHWKTVRSWDFAKKGNRTTHQRISISATGWRRSRANSLFGHSYCQQKPRKSIIL